ncbi:MAG TPA: PAS domain S-box protein [Syntrophales bacterium]|nr:PAS domain S-box protein [Syntrophales bacterium]
MKGLRDKERGGSTDRPRTGDEERPAAPGDHGPGRWDEERELLVKAATMARVGFWEKNLLTGDDTWSQVTREIHEVGPDFRPDMAAGIAFYKEGEDRRRIEEAVSRAIEGGEPFDLELRIVTAKGNERWVRAIGEAEHREGKCLRLFGTFQDIDAFKRAEEALRESERRYRELTESIADLFFGLDGDLRVRYWNRVCEELTGKEAAAALGAEVGEVFPAGAVSEAVRSALTEALAAGERRWIPWEWETRKGRLLFEVTLYPTPDGLSVLGRDVTLRRQIEETLMESEARFRDLVNNARESIFVIQDGRIAFVNAATFEAATYTPSELYGKPFLSFIHPEDRELVKERYERRLRGEEVPSRYTIRLLRRDGAVRWMALNAAVSRWRGRPATLCFMTDITRQREREEALRASEERYRQLFENVQEGILVATSETMDFANPALADLLGYPIEELTSRPFVSFIHPEDRAMVLERHLARLRGEMTTTGYEFRIVRPDGEIRWVFITSRLVNWGGRPATLAFVSDITERKKAEEEKEELERRLERAQRLEAIGTLAGGVAHNFNNLLMGIQGYASLMLLDLAPTHPHYERLKKIEGLVKSGADLTGQLLGFARGGRYEVRVMDIGELVAETARLFTRTRRQIVIDVERPADLWAIKADRTQMEQVFMNLFVNAYQAMPAGGTIRVAMGNENLASPEAELLEVEEGDFVRITVSDTGVGMDEKTKERIFEPFFTTKARGRGTGLGLASVYGIVKGHGGSIEVESSPGEGTTFTILLPATRDPENRGT